jgi:hypothetical protein
MDISPNRRCLLGGGGGRGGAFVCIGLVEPASRAFYISGLQPLSEFRKTSDLKGPSEILMLRLQLSPAPGAKPLAPGSFHT